MFEKFTGVPEEVIIDGKYFHNGEWVPIATPANQEPETRCEMCKYYREVAGEKRCVFTVLTRR